MPVAPTAALTFSAQRKASPSGLSSTSTGSPLNPSRENEKKEEKRRALESWGDDGENLGLLAFLNLLQTFALKPSCLSAF